VDSSTVTAEVGIGPINGGAGYGLEVALVASLPGIERAVAEDLVAKAHEVCPYSNATRGNIKVDLKVA
jgi:organic hydroperoxide reductase OsmC/OhrA